ncbi:MBL fold metallo-hydrolase [Ornithinimicrobium avium]|uniref:MBL fold metallo-hydrolase n=1 Tax=Ornithinimicrobium avium TaxID=2283195 RepID=A0A345NQ05_9MICO|nr:MBL fold metallo-hydrolase [Ornithinimicrobium avium]AXH97113.1 MBL fold metallo-hydrolase [Ornithinimicrobium avium]
MLLERIYDEDLSQASYVVGCQGSGEAVVVDPRRDVGVYLGLAERHGLAIVAVTETHVHADYLSGTRELAAATGAQVYLSGEGGADWQYGFAGRRLHDGEALTVGEVTLTALHTPGHTPEHLSFLVTDGAFAGEAGYLLSGDFVFAGDLGRPDLLDEAAGGVETRFAGAGQVFGSLREKFLTLPDHVQVFPAHGAGSACGKALGALPSTTVGYERRYAWWAPYLAAGDQEGFVAELLAGQPDAHAYFARMKRQNLAGPVVLGRRAPLAELAGEAVRADLEADRVTFVDTRSVGAVHAGTVPGSLSVPVPERAATYGAWAYDPETDSRPLVLLARGQDQAQDLWDHLVRVGVDDVVGYVSSLEGLPLVQPGTVCPAGLEGMEHAVLLDVRNRSEHAAGTIPGAEQLSAGRVLWHQDELPARGRIVTFCQSGVRNAVASAALRRAGFDVVELEGSYDGWLQEQARRSAASS